LPIARVELEEFESFALQNMQQYENLPSDEYMSPSNYSTKSTRTKHDDTGVGCYIGHMQESLISYLGGHEF
jgi:hypothetical protein